MLSINIIGGHIIMEFKTFGQLCISLKEGLENLDKQRSKFKGVLYFSQLRQEKTEEYMEFLLVTRSFKAEDKMVNVLEYLKKKYMQEPLRLKKMLQLAVQGKDYFELGREDFEMIEKEQHRRD